MTGSGADSFIFSGPTDQLTTVTDCDAAQGDKLMLMVSQCGFLGFFGPQIGTEKNPTSSGLYFNTTPISSAMTVTGLARFMTG